jgi:hypothetical protein
MRMALPDDGLRKDAAVAGDQRSGAVVTGRFEAKNNHFVAIFFGGPLPDRGNLH